MSTHDPVAIDYQPGDGWRYRVAALPLPHADFEGGGDPADYAVVACWFQSCGPSGSGRCHVMRRDGYLTVAYVAEKFGVADDAAVHVTAAIAELLGRTTDAS